MTNFDEELWKGLVIVGAGISGLTAAWQVLQAGKKDLLILEVSDSPGGNSLSGENKFSRYPYGAHYLTQPNPGNKELISFLKTKGLVKEENEGKLFYNETDLCFDPEERLLLRGGFQEGLIPGELADAAAHAEISLFFGMMDEFRNRKGNDGRYFFDIPVSMGTADKQLDHLDEITFAMYLEQNGFCNEHLLWYLDYSCRDDFGGGIEKVSAWAGILYFAGRRACPGNTDQSRVLTWPQGNMKLVELLLQDVKPYLQTACLVQNITFENNSVMLAVRDFKKNKVLRITASCCIVATPPGVNKYMLDKSLAYPEALASQLAHIPWIVAAITLTDIPESRGMQLCWDNVKYKSRSLGYIYNQHQSFAMGQEQKVISLYMPLDQLAPAEERRQARQKTAADWKPLVVSELENMHPGISSSIREIDIWVWGHAMVLPAPGVHKSGVLQQLAAPFHDKIFFAHSDLSGYSTFEEAFDQGTNAANKVMMQLT